LAGEEKSQPMNEKEFIEKVAELGIELFNAQRNDPKRQAFIQGVAELGKNLVQSHAPYLPVFEREFINNPDRFRWELLGQTARSQ
jgi:hypothetical protein